MLVITISSPRQVAGVVAAAAQTGETPELYLQRVIEAAAESYRSEYNVDRITAADFILRFTPEEQTAIAASSDELVLGFMQRIRESLYVWLASDEVVSGLAYLVASGYLTTERSNIIAAWYIPPSSD